MFLETETLQVVREDEKNLREINVLSYWHCTYFLPQGTMKNEDACLWYKNRTLLTRCSLTSDTALDARNKITFGHIKPS
jgi:hypothetical protein